MGAVYSVVPVYAQTVNVSNLQYPSTVVLGGQVTVSFTVNWSGAPQGASYVLFAGVADSTTNNWASGTVISSSPNICSKNTLNHWSDCYFDSPQSSGSFTVTFSIDSSSKGTYSYYGSAGFWDCSSTCTSVTYNDSNTFDITIVDTFTLTVNVPGEVPITLDGMPRPTGSIGVDLHPGIHAISVPEIVQIDSTSRLKFNGWSDGSTQLTRTFDLESDSEISAIYVTQYLINATADSTLQTGWYDQGTVLKFNVNSNQFVNSYRLLTGGFDGWYNSNQLISKSPSASVTIDGPVNLTDRWNYLPYLPLVLIVAIVAVVLFFARRGNIRSPRLPDLKMLKPKRQRKRTRRSKPMVETVTPEPERHVAETPEIKEVSASGKTMMYCTQCGAVVPRDSKFCKECGTKQI